MKGYGDKVARIYRISGYLVSELLNKTNRPLLDIQKCALMRDTIDSSCEKWQQLHIEESETFEPDGEFEDNCDLALLTRHFKKNISIEHDRPLPQKGEKYRHFKLGKIVTIIGISRHTETGEVSVVYEYEGTIWNRPFDMFMSEVDKEKYPDVEQKYRFEKLEE